MLFRVVYVWWAIGIKLGIAAAVELATFVVFTVSYGGDIHLHDFSVWRWVWDVYQTLSLSNHIVRHIILMSLAIEGDSCINPIETFAGCSIAHSECISDAISITMSEHSIYIVSPTVRSSSPSDQPHLSSSTPSPPSSPNSHHPPRPSSPIHPTEPPKP